MTEWKKDNEKGCVEDKRIPVWHRFMSQAGTNNDFEIYKHGRLALRFSSRACVCARVCVCLCMCGVSGKRFTYNHIKIYTYV